ncbi:type I phosphomannose isomerase catalytic subunit [Terriglobus tenax]|uniref:type I phosphomannose isomerase catalytic subunit n=1 Tax=Terriglobus tenax TaxID=1111115 RepID=UPI0021E0739F|nr:type I phosphomannose isomerase catalytic subunit [Terriglobus tenax]
MPSLIPFRLKPAFVARIWGRTQLAPWYTEQPTEKIGEAWLTGEQCVVEGGPLAGKTLRDVATEFPDALLGESKALGEFPLLLKILFPDDKLSVQVHPNDEQAAKRKSQGKTECWYVLNAEPGAAVALGFKDPKVPVEAVREAIEKGHLEDLLHFEPVSVGDLVYVDANTVHAIWPGATLLEIQQTSDITYRLYDYGRPRELHLEEGLAVMNSQTSAGKRLPVKKDGFTRLVEERYFSVDRMELPAGSTLDVTLAGKPQCLVLLSGEASIATGNDDLALAKAEAVVVPAATERAVLRAGSDCVVVRSTV